jgi:lipopolysaccharide export system permease protein
MIGLAFERSRSGIYGRPKTLQPYVARAVPPSSENAARCLGPSLRSNQPPTKHTVKILTKYILKEHLAPLLFSLSALTSLLLLNYIAKQFGQLVGKGLDWKVIAEFMLLSVPFTVAMTLPMAVLVATLHAFSRMASENEITAFKASGISLPRLMVPVIIAAGFLTITMVWFNDRVLPAANHRLTTLSNDIARKKPTFALKEQVINPVSPGLFLQTARLYGTNQMRDVAIYDLSDPQTRTTIRADSGELALSANREDLLLTLYHGSWTVLKPEDPTRLRRVFFNTDFVKVRNVGNTLQRDTLGQGEKNDREMTVCELQRQVMRLARSRDSIYREMRSIDSAVAKTMTLRSVSHGIGNLYCHRMSGMTLVRTASAAEIRRGPPAGQQPAQQPVKAAARQPAKPPQQTLPPTQQPVRQPPPAQQKLPDVRGRMLTPLSQPAESTPSFRQVQAQQLKLQVGFDQNIIDGDLVEIEKKFAIAAACVIFVLLGAPVALRFPRGGVGLTIGVSLGVFALYYVGLTVGETLARGNYISPFWAMWSGNFILLAIGLTLTARLGREGATSRGSEASEFVIRAREWFGELRGRR